MLKAPRVRGEGETRVAVGETRWWRVRDMGTSGLHNVGGVGGRSIRWEGEKIHNSTGGRVGLRAWDIWAEMGGEWAREGRWACEKRWAWGRISGVGISGAGLVRGVSWKS